MHQAKKNRKLTNPLIPLNILALFSSGCGGSNGKTTITDGRDPTSESKPAINNVNGMITLEAGSVFVAGSGDAIILTPLRIQEGFTQENIITQAIASDSAEEFNEIYEISVGEGALVFGSIEDFSENGIASNIKINGNLWLYLDHRTTERTTVDLNILLDGKDLTIVMANAGPVTYLSEGSTLNLMNGSLSISEGTFDASNAQLIDIKNLEINSSLRIMTEQLSNISGQVTSNSAGTLNLVANTISDADMILELYVGTTKISGITVTIDSSNPVVCDYLDKIIIPAIKTIDELHSVSRISGPNDAPTELIVTPIAVSENIESALVCIFSVQDPDVNDTHAISISDERFVVIDGKVFLADGQSLDFENQKDIEIVITVTDTGGLSIEREFTVSIIDVNEGPTNLDFNSIRTEVNENQSIASRLKIADLSVTDDDLGTIEYRVEGADAALFQIFGNRLYLKRGVTPNFNEQTSLDITIIAFDPSLPDMPDLRSDFTLTILDTNESLSAATSNSATFKDNDGSSNYSYGDTVLITFNEGVSTQTLTLSDLHLQSGTWGNSSIRPLDASGGLATRFEILLGATSALPAEPVIVIDSGEIQDEFGRSNANQTIFELPPTIDDFDIELVYRGNESYKSVFQAAVDFWETVIIGDLPAIHDVDDLKIFATVATIDGQGGTLAYAGWDRIRTTGNKLPYEGSMTFDSMDMRGMSNSEIYDVAVHEIAHILGFGTLWYEKSLISESNYIGSFATNEYYLAGGDTLYIPLETSGGGGTAYSHWDEEIFGAELMTGYINSGENYFSAITIGAMEDLGYQVSYLVAEPFSFDVSLLA